MAKKKPVRKSARKAVAKKRRSTKPVARKPVVVPSVVIAAADMPAVAQLWKGEGGWRMGECLGENGKPSYHLILVAGPDGKPFVIQSSYGEYKDVPGANSYRDGAAVTDALVASGNELAIKARAVTTIDGQTDCSLAAQCEMNLVRANGGHLLLGGYFWCGTQNDRYNAWCQHFYYGYQSWDNKGHKYSVFFVRRVYIQAR